MNLMLSITAGKLIFTTIVISFFLILAWLRLSHKPRNMLRILAEGTHLSAVLLLTATIFEPELVLRRDLESNPELVVLYDDSGSMNTEDVLSTGENRTSRIDAVKNWLNSGTLEKLKLKYHCSVESFNGNPLHPEGTDLDYALQHVLKRHPKLRGILLFSDGDWNTGSEPLTAAFACKQAGVPVFSVCVGSSDHLQDVELQQLPTPAYAIYPDKVRIPYKLINRMPTATQRPVRLLQQNQLVAENSIEVASNSEGTGVLLWQPSAPGLYHLTTEVDVTDDEAFVDNNSYEFDLQVKEEVISVLIIENLPRWEYRYLRNALQRDPGVHVDVLLLHQDQMPQPSEMAGYLNEFPGQDDLSKYDVVFFGDVNLDNERLHTDHFEQIKGLIKNQGSGLILLSGPISDQFQLSQGSLGELYPVVMEDVSERTTQTFELPSHFAMTVQGRKHLLTMLADSPSVNENLWKQLPGFYWYAPVLRAKVGATVLAVHQSDGNEHGRRPLLVIKSFGNGPVLFLGTDGVWRWRRGVEDKYHYRFWSQVVRWMAHNRHRSYSDRVRLFFDPERPAVGDRVRFHATLLDRAGYPMNGADIQATLTDPDGAVEMLTVGATDADWGVYEAEFTAEKPGNYDLKLQLHASELDFSTQVTVAGNVLERLGQPVNAEVLREIAAVSGGLAADLNDTDKLLAGIDRLPADRTIIHRVPLWNRWWWGAMIVALFSINWSLRKRYGLI